MGWDVCEKVKGSIENAPTPSPSTPLNVAVPLSSQDEIAIVALTKKYPFLIHHQQKMKMKMTVVANVLSLIMWLGIREVVL